MPSTFSGLGIANSGLAAQRRAIETIGQNVSNVNTPGYSRQKVDLSALATSSSGIHTGGMAIGGGVDVVAQTRIVDQFLTGRLNREFAAKGYADVIQTSFSRIESAFDEPSENGLAAQMQNFWDAWDSVVDRPEDTAVRSALLQRSQAVADTFTGLYRNVSAISGDVIQQADAIVADVNSIAGQIASMNTDIAAAMDGGTAPNDLMDRRDMLVDRLSGYLGVTTRLDDRGMMDISIAGSSLVSGTRSNTIALDTTTPGAAVLRLNGPNVTLQPRDGALKGLLHVANTIVPDQLARLDTVANSLAGIVNAQHQLGQDLQAVPVATGNFFTTTGAADFAIDPALVGRPELVGAAMLGAGRYDGSNAAQMAQMSGLAGGPDELYRSMMAELGIEGQNANRRAELQDRVVQQVEGERSAVSGVSLDEELTNLVAFQQAYQASARFMTAIDEMLERLINGTGQVGR